MLVESLGFAHLLGYVLARIGTLHQLFIIWTSQGQNSSGPGLNTVGLSLKYRGSAALLFLSFICWGLSLEPIDWVVTFSRLFSLVLFLIIVRELYKDRREYRAQKWLIFLLFLISLSISIMIFSWAEFKAHSHFLGLLTVILSFNLAWGSWDKVLKIVRAKSPGKQSIIEMSFQLIKDLSGLGYGLIVGFQQMWPLVVALLLISSVRIVNIALHFYYSQQLNHSSIINK